MKAVGEVMGIGRTFEESIQKAIRMVDPKYDGFQGDKFEDLDDALANPTDRRWLAVGQAMIHENYSIDRVHDLSKIDKWFLYKLQNIVDCQHEMEEIGSLYGLKRDILTHAKKLGFSDKKIAKCVNSTEEEVRQRRKGFDIRPFVKKIDTLAAEFPADTNYLYTTYNATTHDVQFTDHGIIVLGSGVYRIGSSVEFDWCAVNATLSLKNLGKKTVMINYNPEVGCNTQVLVHTDLSFRHTLPTSMLRTGFTLKSSAMSVSWISTSSNAPAVLWYPWAVNFLKTLLCLCKKSARRRY